MISPVEDDKYNTFLACVRWGIVCQVDSTGLINFLKDSLGKSRQNSTQFNLNTNIQELI
jgi:hypothetical protein